MNFAYDIFLLMFNLSQLSKKELIIELFIDSINEIFSSAGVTYSEEQQNIRTEIQVRTIASELGFIYVENYNSLTSEEKILLKNSVQMFAIILENVCFREHLQSEKRQIELVADERMTKLQETVNELKNTRLASLNLIEDLTEEVKKRKETVAALSKSEERLSLALRATNDVIWDWNIIEDSQMWNETGKNVFGWADITNEPQNAEWWSKKVHPEDYERMHKSFYDVVNSDTLTNWEDEYRFRKSDGNYAIVNDRGYVIRDSDGKAMRMIGAMQDVTHKRIMEMEIIESEERYRLLIESTSDLVALMDLKGNYTFCNGAYKRILGYEPVELIGKSAFDLVHPDDREYVCNLFKESVNNKEEITELSVKILCSDKSIKWVKHKAKLLFDSERNPEKVLLFAQDFTDRKAAEDALLESETKYRLLIENQGEGVSVVDWDERFVFANYAAENLFGVRAGELLGRRFTDFVVPEQLMKVFEETQKRKRKEKSSYEVEIVNARGETKFLLITATPQINEESVSTGTFAVFRDITDRKHAEEELLKLSQVVKQSPVSIVITDLNGNIEYVNPKFEKVTGYLYHEVIGKNPRILKSNTKSSEEYSEMWSAISSGKEWSGEFLNKKKDGTLFWESASIIGIRNLRGVISGYIGVKEDITEKKVLDLQLKKALEKAEESARVKTSLLLNMSHEFRTPMTGILGMSTILKEVIADEDKQVMLDGIVHSGKRLMNTLDAVLEFAHLEGGERVESEEPLNINETVKNVVSDFKHQAELKGLVFKTEIKESGLFVRLNSKNVSLILSQLLDNAIKFTEEGEITFILGLEILENHEYASISIRDTGCGIEEENYNTIFEDFRQVSEGTARSHEGVGLGLSLVNRIVGLANGKILLKSELGKGSEFTVCIPAVRLQKEVSKNKSEDRLAKKTEEIPTILLVEDNMINKLAVVNFLKGICKIDHALNGLKAIELAESNSYPLILMDINLGRGIDGIAATKEIRKITGYENTPIIAVTGYSMESDRLRFLSEGLTHFIAKPFIKKELRELVEDILINN